MPARAGPLLHMHENVWRVVCESLLPLLAAAWLRFIQRARHSVVSHYPSLIYSRIHLVSLAVRQFPRLPVRQPTELSVSQSVSHKFSQPVSQSSTRCEPAWVMLEHSLPGKKLKIMAAASGAKSKGICTKVRWGGGVEVATIRPGYRGWDYAAIHFRIRRDKPPQHALSIDRIGSTAGSH